MDFFAMKRKKLQSLCKKHGIPANLKNKDMAEKLSLIYKEEKNENHGSHRLRSDADKSNVEIIVLDSDSDSDVHMEDTVAEKDCNEKTNVSAEHLLDEEPDQALTSSPLSKVKSDFNAPHTDNSGIAAGNADACEVKSPAPSDLNICHIADSAVKHTDEVKSSGFNNLVSRPLPSDEHQSNLEITELDSYIDTDVQMEASDTVAEKDSNKTDVRAGHLLEKEPDLNTSPLGEVKSRDLNVQYNVDSGTAAGNAYAYEVKLATPGDHNVHDMIDSGTAAGHIDASEVRSAERRGSVGSFHMEEDIQMSANSLDGFGNYMMLRDFQISSESTDVHEDTDVHQGSVDQVPKLGDYHCVISQAATTCLDASPCAKSTNDNTNVNVENTLDEVHSSSFGDSDGTPVQFLKTNPLSEVDTSDLDADKMVVTGTAAGHIDASEVRSAERKGSVGSFRVEEDIQMSANSLDGFGNYMMLRDFQTSSESTDVHEDTDVHQGSVDQVPKLGDYHCVISQAATTCLDASPCARSTNDNTNVNVENTLDEVHSSSFGDSDGTPVQFLKTNPLSEVDTSDLDADKMVVTASKEIIGSSTKLLINSVSPRDVIFCNVEESVQIGANEEQVDPSQKRMMEFFPKLFNNPGTPSNGDTGLCGLEENFEIGINRENIDPNEDVMHAEPNAMVMSHNEDLMLEDEVANVDDKFDFLESVPGSVNPGITNNTQLNSDIGTDVQMEASDTVAEKDFCEKTNVRAGHLLDKEPDQFLTTSPHSEVKSSDLNVQQTVDSGTAAGNANACEVKAATPSDHNVYDMIDSGTATKSACTSGAKFESSQKMSTSPASKEIESVQIGANKEQVDPNQEKMREFSPKLFNNPGSPTNGDIGFCGFEENLEICVNKENIDPDEDVMHAEPSAMVMSDNEDLIQAVSEALGNNLMEDEVANVDDRFDLLENVPGSVNPGDRNSTQGSNINTGLMNTYVTGGDLLDEILSSSFAESAGSPVQFLPIDPLREAGTTVHKMFETDTASEDEDSNQRKLDSAEDENQAYHASQKRKRSDVDDINGANSNKEVKANKFVPAGPQSSEKESSDFGLKQLFAQDTASGDEDAIQKMLESPSKAASLSSGEKSTLFTPEFNESSMMHKEMEISMIEEENNREGCISAQREVSKFFDTSDVHDDIGLDGPKDENQAYSTSRKRKMSDVDNISGANSDKVKTDDLFPAVAQSSEMESCDFGLRQLIAKDTVFEDEDAYQKKLDSSSTGTPIAATGEKSITFTPKLHESSMMHKKMRIEMNLSQKPAARDSVGSFAMKENIKIDKEDISSTVSRNKFAKRLPLQDLHQN